MQVRILAGSDVFDAALKSARAVRAAPTLSELAAPLDASVRAEIDETWEAIEEALRAGFRHGYDGGKALLDAAWEKVKAIAAAAGRKASQVYDLLLTRTQQFLATFINGAISRLTAEHHIAGVSYRLSSISCTQKIVLTGSLEAALTNAFALSSSGEIEVTAEYARRPRQEASERGQPSPAAT
jgi:hypothetical protein